jgi:hypothetical protein
MSIKKAAQRLAKKDGVSLNQWIAVVVAEKIGVVEAASEFLRKRAGSATWLRLLLAGVVVSLETILFIVSPAPKQESPLRRRRARAKWN